MKRLLGMMLALLAAGMIGCGGKPAADTDGPVPIELTGVNRATPEDEAAVVQGINQFAFDLLGRLDKNENAFFSPAGLSTVLAMTYAGARGLTAEQMARVLHFTLDSEHLHRTFATLSWKMWGSARQLGNRLALANALWGDQTIRFAPEFVRLTKENYVAAVAGLQRVDFAKPEDARRDINAWVAERTGGRIKDFLQAEDVSKETRLVLTSAIDFQGAWEHIFQAEATREQPFRITSAEKVSTPMMHQTGEFSYFADEANAFQLLELPYKNLDLSMVVLLPRSVDGLARLEKNLTAPMLAKGLEQTKKAKVAVALPKFALTRRIDLAKQLEALGMRVAFDPGQADLSGMTGDRSLFLGKLLHEARVEVNEKGTQAAAATGAIAKSEDKPEQPITFQADHPFLFLIRDAHSGSILFLGRLSNPKN
jgi:serpin B